MTMGKLKMTAQVVSQDMLAKDIYSLVLSAPEIARQAAAGQFVSVYTHDMSRLLPRPISLCVIDAAAGTLRLVYRVVGYGTDEFSHLTVGETVDILGPLGNGFMKSDKRAILVGGGIGIPPMLELARELDCEKSVVLGYRDEIFLADEFREYADVYIASEDGAHGVKGNVIDAICGYKVTGDVIYACGPLPMLRGLKAYAKERGLECQISMEERMACGVGACLACVCDTTDVDEHSQVKNRRVCKDGPVFYAEEVEL